MFRALEKCVSSQPDGLDAFLSLEHTVYDWTRPGLFTGSRVSEYAQTWLKAKDRYNIIPTTLNAGNWAGQAIAFIRADFVSYTAQQELIQLSDLYSSYLSGNVVSAHICFCFDKSPRNFSICKFQRTDDPILDPVATAVSCIHCADLFQLPLWEPIGAFGAFSCSPAFLRDYHISNIMCKACEWAYPNPNHYMRVHIMNIVPHSNCITAAVSLKLDGASDEDIVFRLRWHVSSVPMYLRECFDQVGTIVLTTLAGAYRTAL
jgi:hypothetical protein